MASELGRTLLENRSKDSTSTPDELLVFGYSCKLFRDNEKASFLDKGGHLIPWMGDDKLMIDRFDVRGALYDLKEAESGGGADRWEGLTEEEKADEERCDYERYLALYHDDIQHQAYQEEETKRLLAELGSDNYTYSQVGFSYDDQTMLAQQNYVVEQVPEVVQPEVEEPQEEEEMDYFPEKDEDTFVPPPELNVPMGMVVPETVKQNKIILKTSKFIAAQGGQMEILIKTKQAGNPMFSFLSFDHPLNAFYKHTTTMIKSGRYRPADDDDVKKARRDSEGSEGQYLHPSLSAGIKPDLTPGTPLSLHKPSADCSYSKLINKIKEKQKNSPTVEGIESPGSPSVSTIVSAPVVALAAAAITTPVVAASTPVAAPSTPAPSTPAPSTPAVVPSTPVVATSTPVADTKAPVVDASTPATGQKLDLSNRKKKKKGVGKSDSPEFKGLVDYPSFNRTNDNCSDDERKDDDELSDVKDKPDFVDGDELLATENSNEYANIKWPPPDVQMVIDKMASYIIKNGEEFESMVRTRNDPRFSFLNKDHEYFPYYRCKMRLYNEVYGDIFKENFEDKSSATAGSVGNGVSAASILEATSASTATPGSATTAGSAIKKDKRTSAKVPSTISFSIKSREQEVNLDRHSTFPVESSSTDDEDMDEEEREKRRIEREERRRKRKQKEKEEREKRERLEKERLMEKAEESSEASDDNEDVYDIFKYAQEMGGDKDDDPNLNDKFSNGELKKSQSSIAQNGNGHTPSAQPERKQQERRKKAAMFLSRLKKGSEDESSQPVYGPQLPPEIAAQMMNSTSRSGSSSSRSSEHSSSRSRSRSSSPGSGIPMPPQDSPAPPPPPPPIHSPSPTSTSNIDNEWGSNSEIPAVPDYGEDFRPLKRESSVLSGASEGERRSQSLEIRTSKSRHVDSSHREKSRSRKKHRHERSESRSPSSRRERKKRKRSRSRSRRHKKRRSRSRSHSKSHSKSSHKKKRRKHSSRHDRSERRSKRSRRSVSSSSSDSSEVTYSSRSSTPSESEVQVIDSPSQSKRGSRASSVVSVYASDLSILSSGLPRILEESLSAPGTPPIPAVSPSSTNTRLASVTQEKLASDKDSATDAGNGGSESEMASGPKEEKKEEKKLFDPQNSAAMARIAQGLRAKVHALLEKENKL
ncbi:splicing factor, suppressor of white-apricot homolog isoform X2 [Palaemon carinicauda]|uniref:splicing factor, suppressor of white-apricot homolog isoform X2 n=1 Tax=Palaemon carinicauda TaxID=392227 RepID=UPI0035B5D7CC